MTVREREKRTLNFCLQNDRGSVEETFAAWDLTAMRFADEGMPANLANGVSSKDGNEKYFQTTFFGRVLEYERWLGFDPVRRIHFTLPFRALDKQCQINDADDWKALYEHSEKEREKYFKKDSIVQAFQPMKAAHDNGDYSIRLNLEGFFWTPRELIGVEEHLYSFYDMPELLHEICEYTLEIYTNELKDVITMLQPDVVYFMEDLSGKNGPMISGEHFDEFVGHYYKKLFPLLREWGVGNIFVDTDGEFSKLIPNFIEAGVDGFLPLDVNAGMDIVKVRRDFPNLKFIGGYNKLAIAEGPYEIDKEFDRVMPVIASGGYIPGADHQVAPSTSLQNYQYYIEKLKTNMCVK